MSQSDNLWKQLNSELIPRLAAVGFSATEFPAPTPVALRDVSFSAFLAPYGLLYCAQIPLEGPDLISGAINFACDTMRSALIKADANDWTRDGYLIAAVSAAPATEAARQLLRDFEQGRSICRRHVVWPESDDKTPNYVSWTRKLDRVTVLALPEPETSAARGELPENIPWFVEHVHNRMISGATYTEVAAELKLLARQREDLDAS